MRRRMPPNTRGAAGTCFRIERVYDNARARELGWRPRYDFAHVVECLRPIRILQSARARRRFEGLSRPKFVDGPFPVD
jgi:UDP-glucose 4-epimerase